MTRFGVAIEKQTAFRGGVQHFNNTYYYEIPVTPSALPELEDLVDTIVTKEKAFHATTVTFTRGRCWSQIGTPAQNEMLIDKALSGAGALSDGTTLDRERAVLVQLRAGVDTRGRPVYLRKWFHTCASLIGGSAFSNTQLQQTAQLNTTQKDAIVAIGNDLKSIGVGAGDLITCTLVAKNGRGITGATTAHPYLEHHQLGDEWRNV